MTLDELKEQNQQPTVTTSSKFIDTTAGKVEKPNPIQQPIMSTEPADPYFATNTGYRSTKRTPTQDEDVIHTEEATTHTEEVKMPSMKVVNTTTTDFSEMKPLDLDSLPKRPPEVNPLEETLMAQLEEAVDNECKDITERIQAITEKQYEEMLELQRRTEAENLATIPDDMENMQTTDIEVEKEVHTLNDDYGIDTVEADNTAVEVAVYEKESPTVYEEEVVQEFPVLEDKVVHTVAEEDTIVVDDDSSIVITDYEDDISTSLDMDGLNTIEDDLKSEFGESVIADANEVNEAEMLDELRTAVKKNISHVKNKIDLSQFSVSKTPVAASKAIGFSIRDTNKADWVLPNAGSVISVSGLSGPEIFSMDPSNSNRSKINTLKDIYSIIYKHVLNKGKITFEAWMKKTRFSDIQHIYFALYKATFSNSNFVHYECPSCHHVFIKDIDFDSVVKYKDDETKAKITEILTNNVVDIKPYPITRYQASDDYVIDIKEPSIWNTVIELSSLSDSFLEKYESLVDTITFIDNIYIIDYDNNTLQPVDTKPVANNIGKTIANKISIYSDIIRNIPSDNFFDLRAKVASQFNANAGEVSYFVPGCNCPKCNTAIADKAMEGSELLFTRHQLGALGAI